MVQITFISSSGVETTIEANVGETVMEAAQRHAIEEVLADCGGSMVCGTCHAFVSDDWQAKLPEQCDMETGLLEFVPEPAPNGRLTCQIPVTESLDGIVFSLPEHQR